MRQGKRVERVDDGLTPKERREKREKDRKERLESKIALAQQNDTSVVYNRTLDARFMSQFINSLDFLMDRARRSLGHNRKLTFEIFQRLLDLSGAVMFLSNLCCAKVSRVMDSRYVQPRGHLDLSKRANAGKAVEEIDRIIAILQLERQELAAVASSVEEKPASEAAGLAEASAKQKKPAAAAPVLAPSESGAEPVAAAV